MSSSFRRKRESSHIFPGTKAWTSGTTLVSTGLRELDTILGSGQPLGTCIFLDEDRWTTIGQTIVSYWCGEGLVHDQQLIIPFVEENGGNDPFGGDGWPEAMESNPLCCSEDKARKMLQTLPWSMNIELDNKNLEGTHQAKTEAEKISMMDQLGTVNEEEQEDDPEEGLVVAWQYRKEVQDKRRGVTTSSKPSKGSRSFCHSFDLKRKLLDQINVNERTVLISAMDVSNASRHQGFLLFKSLKIMIEKAHSKNPKQVVRLLLLHVDLILLSSALPLLMGFIRRESLPVVILISNRQSCGVSKSQSGAIQVQRNCDVVLAAEGFAGRHIHPPPAEFRHFMGLLKIRKTSTCTLAGSVGHFADGTTQRRPPANVYGVKRDQRKLHLSLLHIPPEEFAAHGGSVGGGAVRSGAGRPAGSSVSCASTAIDF